MAEPVRWIEDPELDPNLRAELAAAAAAPPPPLDVEAGHARLMAAIGGGGGGPDGGPSSGPSGAGPWLAGGAAVVAVIVGVGAWLWLGDDREAATVDASPPRLEAAAVEPPAAAPARVSDPVVSATDLQPSPPEPATPAPEAAPAAAPASPGALAGRAPRTPAAGRWDDADPAAGARVRRADGRARAPSGPADPNALREEMRLLQRARRALATAPAEALTLVAEGDRRFPRGVFAPEREGIAALASLRLGRAGAAGRARRYLRRHPRGAMSDQIRAALETR